jgi:hypothetical protein
MRRELRLVGLVVSGAVAFSANAAADGYVTAPAGPVWYPSWSGLYAGVNAGYGWGNVKASDQACSTFVTTEAPGAGPNDGDESPNFTSCNSKTANLNSDGAFGGGQFGINIQRGILGRVVS